MNLADGIAGFEWAQPWVSFLQRQSQSLFVVFLIFLYIEIVTTKGLRDLIVRRDEARVEAQLQYLTSLTSPKQMLINGFQRSFPDAPHAGFLIDILGREISPLTEVDIDWVLHGTDDSSDHYCYFLKSSFQTSRLTYRVAITRSSQESEHLMSSGLFDDTVILSANADIDHEVTHFMSSSKLQVRNSKGEQQQALPFRQLTAPQLQRLLAGMQFVLADNCRAFQVDLPRIENDSSMFFEYSESFNLSVAEHHCYWSAPCLMYINNIRINTSQFPSRERWKFFIQPFLGISNTGRFDPTDDHYVIPVHAWLTPGHGVVVIWQELPDST